MIGAAMTSRAPWMGLQGDFDLLANSVDRVEVGPEYLHANVGADAGREHLDAVDDRLREDVAPAGHLQHASHFIVDQIALGTSLPRPEKHALSKWNLQFLAE